MEKLILNCENMKRVFLIKRKGFNYYGSYTEKNLHQAFEHKGYYLVKEQEKRLFGVIVDAPMSEKYMTVLSPFFDTLSEEEAYEFAEILSEKFKSEVRIDYITGNYEIKDTPYVFMFSDVHNAFDEDVYVVDSEPEFVRESYSVYCKSGDLYSEEYVNYGGRFKGIEISISFDVEDVEIEDAFLAYEPHTEVVRRQIVFEKKNGVFVCVLDDFSMDKGINKHSAVLRGKKLQNEKYKHGFSIIFKPKSNAQSLVPKVYVKSLSYI